MGKKQEDDVDRLAALFDGHQGAHGTHGTPDRDPDGLKWTIKKTARTILTPPTMDLWRAHVAGKTPLGVIPIRQDSTCGWGSIDFDVYDVDLLDVVKRAETTGLPLVPCVSKSGGLHLFLFLKEAEPAADVQNVLRDAAAALGMAECEIFPKQQKVLTDKGDVGNWMVMPYFGDTFGGKLKMQCGLKRTGAEMTLQEFVAAGEAARTTVKDLTEICVSRRASSGGKKESSGEKRSKSDFSDGPPCLQHITATGPQGDGRKRTLFMMALYFKRSDPSGWKAHLERANQAYFKPPLPAEEVLGVAKSVDKKDYNYTCKEEPMRSHCNAALCKTRRFGVGRDGEYPKIDSLQKLLTDPPLWFVTVEGETLELTTEDLQTYQRFHRACMEKLDKSYRSMRQDAWFSFLSSAMESVSHLPPPSPDIGMKYEFRTLLSRFLTNRARGKRPEDLYLGRPYGEDGKYYFQLLPLREFLMKEGRKYSENFVIARLRELGAGKHQFNFKNRGSIRTWWVHEEKLESTQIVEPEQMEEEEDL